MAYQVDLASPSTGLAVEIDGTNHRWDPKIRQRDGLRQRVLDEAGWLTLRFSNRQIQSSVGSVVAEIASVSSTSPSRAIRLSPSDWLAG
jgi:very-short-patch-repair endonuclease